MKMACSITKTKENQLKCAVDIYDQMLSWYADFLQTENGKDCIAEFDRTLPGYVWMSDVKKLIFIFGAFVTKSGFVEVG